MAGTSSAVSNTAQPSGGNATDSDGDGLLDAPDTAAAAAGAKGEQERVEDLSQRTGSASVFANADGSFTRRDFGATVRVKKAGEWVPVDYTLVEQADGSYAPKASDVDITVGGGSASEAARVQLDGDESLAFTWPTDLPKPVVDGGVATYKLSQTSDLVIAVTSNGVTARIRLNEQPTTDDPAFNLGLRADSLDLEQKPTTGALEITDQDGKTVGGAEQLLAWDSATDEAGDPSNVVELDAELEQTTVAGDVTNHSLELTAPDGFLSDPETEYPVTIDPNIRVGEVRDTWVRAGQSTTYGDDFRLVVGKVNGSDNTNPARSYLKFFDSRVDTNPNVVVTKATVSLWQYYGYSCTDRRMYAMAAGSAWGDNLSWGSPAPGGTGTAAYVDDNRGAAGCGQGWTKLNITSMVDAWNTGAIDNNGLRLHAGDETLSAFERRFCSMDPVSSESICNTATRSPVLDVTYVDTAAVVAAAKRVSAGAGSTADYTLIQTAGIASQVVDGKQAPVVTAADEDDQAEEDLEGPETSDDGTGATSPELDCVVGVDEECVEVQTTEDTPETSSTEAGTADSEPEVAEAAAMSKCGSEHRARRYTVSVTQKSLLGDTIYTWYHRIHYCTKSGKVTKWRGRYDGLSRAQSIIYFRGLEVNQAASANSVKSTWSQKQRHLESCLARYGCYASHHPWSKLTVTGSGGKSAKKGK